MKFDEQFLIGIYIYGYIRTFTNKKDCGPIILPKKKGKKILVDKPGRFTFKNNNPINPFIELLKIFPIVNKLFALNDCNFLNNVFGTVEIYSKMTKILWNISAKFTPIAGMLN